MTDNHSRLLTLSRFLIYALLAVLTCSVMHAADAQSYNISVLHNFDDANTLGGEVEAGPLIIGNDGNFYGLTAFGGTAREGVAFQLTPSGTYTILHDFGGSPDGSDPQGSLLQGIDGNFYGVTYSGGTAGRGTAFKMSPTGAVTILHNFGDGTVPDDGTNPDTGLVQGRDGTLYGATDSGAIFLMTPAGAYQILHVFNGTDGGEPSGLVIGNDGDIYGGTLSGGLFNNGTIFRVTPDGEFKSLYSFTFTEFTGGRAPDSPMLAGADGNLYGVASGAGSSIPGTLFEFSSSGNFSVLHDFADFPYGSPIQDSSGTFYGTTVEGGVFGFGYGWGTVYSLTKSGVFTTLCSFNSLLGQNPDAGLVIGADGDLYGTAQGGGTFNQGTIFKVQSGPLGPVTSFAMTSPLNTQAGVPFNITVSAVDDSGNVVPTYTGTVNFSSSDPNATLPGNTTLTNGVGTFSSTMKTVGYQSITATDTATTTITGSTSSISVSPGPVTTFTVAGPVFAPAGVPFRVTITATDQFGNIEPTYAGTVHFTSTDGSAILPVNSTLTKGVGSFSVTLNTGGIQTITATDTVNAGITGGSSIACLTAFYLIVTAPPSVTAGVPFTFTVVARDQLGNTAANYAGTLHFSTNAPRSTMPSNSTLTNGTGTFTATLTDAGTSAANFKIDAVDTATPIVHGASSAISVVANSTTTFVVNAPTVVHGNVPFNVTVTARDNYFNTTTGYTGTVHFTSSDGSAVLPSNTTLTNGFGTFSVTLKTEGTQTITATDTVTPSITGTSNSIYDLTAQHLLLTTPASVTAGTPFSFTVTAVDKYYNVAPGYAGTVHFVTNAPRSTLPGPSTLTDGTGTFNATFTDVGAHWSIGAGDSVIGGSSSSIVVNP